jgi:hypothetical protein
LSSGGLARRSFYGHNENAKTYVHKTALFHSYGNKTTIFPIKLMRHTVRYRYRLRAQKWDTKSSQTAVSCWRELKKIVHIYGDVMLGVLFSSVGKSMPKRIQSSPNDFTSNPTQEVATVDE